MIRFQPRKVITISIKCFEKINNFEGHWPIYLKLKFWFSDETETETSTFTYQGDVEDVDDHIRFGNYNYFEN